MKAGLAHLALSRVYVCRQMNEKEHSKRLRVSIPGPTINSLPLLPLVYFVVQRSHYNLLVAPFFAFSLFWRLGDGVVDYNGVTLSQFIWIVTLIIISDRQNCTENTLRLTERHFFRVRVCVVAVVVEKAAKRVDHSEW